jgi:hypothetical protein
MHRPRPPHLQRRVTRHGKIAWYVRIGRGPLVRVRSEFGTPEFDVEYQAALSGTPRDKSGAPSVGTLAWLVERYRETTAWTTLSEATRRQRENILKHVLESAGQQPFAKITHASVLSGRERRSATPAQARNFLDTMRGLFRWALDARLVRSDPTAGVKNPIVQKETVSAPGPRRMSPPMSGAGRSARASASGLTCCSTPGCGAAMLCDSGVSTCATVWRRSRPRRAASPSK